VLSLFRIVGDLEKAFSFAYVISGVSLYFKVAIFFDIEYLRNDTIQSHSYNRSSIGSHRHCIEW